MHAPVAVNDLTKRYGHTTVVDGVTFTVDEGEVLALLGPNGAGKTTTVECISGLRRPEGGTVRLLGADPLDERSQAVEGLGMMLQEGGVHRAATPNELLRLFAAFYADPADPAELAARLGLEPVANRRVRTLSTGERQRVNLALALVGRPRVAVLDEPTAAMDPATRRDVWELIEQLRTDGVAVLLTTHSMEEAERLADRVAVINHGRLLALDTLVALTGGGKGLVVATSSWFDADELAAELGAAVVPDRPGQWLVAVGSGRLAEVAAWFAERDLPVTAISEAADSLEDVYLRLTDSGEQS